MYGAITDWKVIYNNFSTVVDATQGLGLWDFTPDCGVQSVIDAADQWIDQNAWVHKTDVSNFSIAKQAALPIIEYDWDLELNEWTFANPVWKYRSERFVDFADTTAQPQIIELTPLYTWVQGGLFEEDKEAAFFDSREELLEKCRHYLVNSDVRQRIAQAGYQRCLTDRYSNAGRLEAVLPKFVWRTRETIQKSAK